MKILILSQYWFPEDGAPQRRWQGLASELSGMGNELFVIAPPPVYKRRLTRRQWMRHQVFSVTRRIEETGPSGETILRSPFIPGGRSVRIRALNQSFVAVGAAITAIFRGFTTRRRPDVVVGTVPALPTLFLTYFLATLCRRHFIIDLRDAWPELLAEVDDWGRETEDRPFISKVFLNRRLQRAFSEFFYSIFRRASAIIVTTEGHASLMRGRLGKNGPTIHVIRNVYTHFKVEQTISVRSNSDSLRVLYAGTIGRAQQLTNAVEAVAIARQKYGIEVHLRVIGDGAGWESTRERARELNVPLEIAHHLPASNLIEHYDWADTALVHLAPWQSLENTVPSKTYELLQLGLHITMVARGEASELVQNLGAGVSVQPGDPDSLAKTWSQLVRGVLPLTISGRGGHWVRKQRDDEIPRVVREILKDLQK